MKRTIFFLFAAILLSLVLCSCSAAPYNITVDILDLGKADCILIDTGSKTVMIDTGEEEDVSDIMEYLDAKQNPRAKPVDWDIQ